MIAMPTDETLAGLAALAPDQVDAHIRRAWGSGPMNSTPPNHFFVYGLTWDTIAAASSSLKVLTIEKGFFFVIDRLESNFRLNATYTTDAAGSYLHRDGSPNNGENDALQLAALRVEFTSVNQAWQNEPIGLDLITGSGHRPNWLDFKPILRGGQNLTVRLYNDASVAVKGQLVFRGRHYAAKG